MSAIGGIISHVITSADINTLTLVGLANIDYSRTGDFDDGYEIFINHPGDGCNSSSIDIELNDNVVWKNIGF